METGASKADIFGGAGTFRPRDAKAITGHGQEVVRERLSADLQRIEAYVSELEQKNLADNPDFEYPYWQGARDYLRGILK